MRLEEIRQDIVTEIFRKDAIEFCTNRKGNYDWILNLLKHADISFEFVGSEVYPTINLFVTEELLSLSEERRHYMWDIASLILANLEIRALRNMLDIKDYIKA